MDNRNKNKDLTHIQQAIENIKRDIEAIQAQRRREGHRTYKDDEYERFKALSDALDSLQELQKEIEGG